MLARAEAQAARPPGGIYDCRDNASVKDALVEVTDQFRLRDEAYLSFPGVDLI
jgi:hypothetical protein